MIKATTITYSTALPALFVPLSSVDPTIVQSVRYATIENLVGRPITGYDSQNVFVTKPTADALVAVQAELRKDGYSLVVYDGYRPQRAVDDFYSWSQEPGNEGRKTEYYPTVPKAELFSQHYFARKSGHTRGSTVDLSIIKLDQKLHPIVTSERTLPNGDVILFLDDGSVDMGASFDLLHPVSSHGSDLVSQEISDMRQYLHDLMIAHGFKDYVKEWWHYTLVDEPYPDTYFDFPVTDSFVAT